MSHGVYTNRLVLRNETDPVVLRCVESSNTLRGQKNRKVFNPLKRSGYYVYRAGVTMCTAQWLLCVPHSGYYVYRTVVTMCTTSCNTHKFCVLFVCSVWISEQTASIARHSTNWRLSQLQPCAEAPGPTSQCDQALRPTLPSPSAFTCATDSLINN